MAKATANGLELEYEVFGDDDGVPLLLIMGWGAQLLSWDAQLCDAFADRGFRVVRYDNRDCGLSSKIPDGTPYTVADMATDAAGLLDFLDIDAAHIVGASMGGLIAQELALNHRERVLTLTSIMSTTSAPGVGAADPELTTLLMTPVPTERDAFINDAMMRARHVQGDSPEFPFDEDRARALITASYDRSFCPEGRLRQLAAVVSSPDRTERLRHLDVPTLVIHGSLDRLVTPGGGEATAAAIPGAELLMIEGMGHSLPPMAWPQVVEAVTRLAARAAVEA
jgi:pimeloyl-ACP methyl ester carboxylesterase